MKFIGIIPARYGSSRFPGKPLADMDGKPMIQRVYEQVSLALDDVWVATDDDRIAQVVRDFGGNAVITSTEHRSGTDRCNEAYSIINKDFDVVINIQGDEPFIQAQQIEALKNCFDSKEVQLATLIKAFKEADDFMLLFNSNTPKVIFNKDNEAIYFSRSIVPYIRDVHHTEWLKKHTFYKHIGMYGYRADVLKEITQLEPSSLEIAESLEQLRWIENGYKIKVGFTDVETLGIDTPEDMEKAIQKLRDR